MASNDHLLLIDASGFAFRAYYAWNPCYRESDGLPTWAILGFMSMVWRVLGRAESDRPTHTVAVFDAPGKNWRHDIFPAYKQHRDVARRLELDRQFPYMRHAAETLGFHPVELSNYEADDVIATLAYRAIKQGIRVTIVSSDKDFGQLVVDGKIAIVDPMKRRLYVEKDIRERWGVEPGLVPDVQALSGDAVDGIPGVEGCGVETAAKLIRSFGNLEKVLKGAEDVRFPRIRRELLRTRDGRTGAQWVRLYRKLTTLRRNAPMRIDFDKLRREPVMESHLRSILRSLEAESKFDILFSDQSKMLRFYPHIENPLEWWEQEVTIKLGGLIPEEPQCGYFKRKLIHGGPWVGARIWRTPELDLETDKPTGRDVMRCEVGGKPCDPLREWPRLCNYPCPVEEFNFEIADADHARRYRPGDAKATPNKPIDFMEMKSPRCPPSPPKKHRRKS